MRCRWLLPSTLGALLLSFPVNAAELQSWRFDANRNRLEFTTDDAVQPRAQLIANPTRLVIDLPGVKLSRPLTSQTVGSGIQSIRLGQFTPDTARIVIELAPGYTLDPEQVRVRGTTPNQWSVELPTPQYVGQSAEPNPGSSDPAPIGNEPGSNIPGPATGPSNAAVEGVQVTQDGIFVRTSGQATDVVVNRNANRDQIQIALTGTTISPRLSQRNFIIGRYGVNRLQIAQIQTSPPVTQITLNVASNAPDWRATVTRFGGVALVPSEGVASTRPTPGTPGSGNPGSNQLATIESVQLEGSQLLIRSDRPISSNNTGWDRASNAYRITLNSARLSSQTKGPTLGANSSLLRVQLKQVDPQTVAILLQPATGVQIGALSRVSNQLLALQLQRGGQPVPGGTIGGTINVPPPTNPNPSPTTPRVPNGRFVVMIDPGHGGPDPGAIGIGGLQEKGIVLDISRQIATILEQQGITAILTRSDDRDLDLEPRVQMAKRANATVFVSIHANSINLSRPDINGLETYYYSSGERLARTIHRSVLQNIDIKDRGVRSARFYVLRRTSMPSVLVEVGFVTGREDAARLNNPAARSQMAAAIAKGIIQYLKGN